MKRLTICVAMAFTTAHPATVIAQAPDYSDAPTETCLLSKLTIGDRMACIGASAGECMAAGGGSYVESFCYDNELSFWDTRLNIAYQAAIASARTDHPDLADALLALQRAWITYRDAECNAVFEDWGEGTGRSPEFLSCHMTLTAQQALMLEQNQ